MDLNLERMVDAIKRHGPIALPIVVAVLAGGYLYKNRKAKDKELGKKTDNDKKSAPDNSSTTQIENPETPARSAVQDEQTLKIVQEGLAEIKVKEEQQQQKTSADNNSKSSEQTKATVITEPKQKFRKPVGLLRNIGTDRLVMMAIQEGVKVCPGLTNPTITCRTCPQTNDANNGCSNGSFLFSVANVREPEN